MLCCGSPHLPPRSCLAHVVYSKVWCVFVFSSNDCHCGYHVDHKLSLSCFCNIQYIKMLLKEDRNANILMYNAEIYEKKVCVMPSMVLWHRVCCLRFCARRKTQRRRPSRCWSTYAPCRTSCSFRRPSATASIRRRGSEASRRRPPWARLRSSARRPVGPFR